jgi:hypothetical protein
VKYGNPGIFCKKAAICPEAGITQNILPLFLAKNHISAFI